MSPKPHSESVSVRLYPHLKTEKVFEVFEKCRYIMQKFLTKEKEMKAGKNTI